ncbi:hypothetical protein CsatA_015251 [Cannabis sativa]|uniref:Uncharacterized protein n=1 Tax=Cannabis sativa TaxID=3483 RepID=A0A803QN91_CANSA
MLDGIKKEIVPDHSKLSEIFTNLGIRDSSSCREEIESLQEEVQNQNDDKSKSELVALIGIVRYTKCVLLTFLSFSFNRFLTLNWSRRLKNILHIIVLLLLLLLLQTPRPRTSSRCL